MKKKIALFLAIILVLSLTACGENNNTPSGGTPDETTAALSIPTEGDQQSGTLVSSASKYSEAYKNYESVYSAMYDTYEALIGAHNAAIEESNDEYFNDPNHFTDVVTFFLSISIAYTATLGDENYEFGIQGAFEMLDRGTPTIEETSPGSYRLTYTATYYDTETWESQENVPYETLCSFNASNGALHFREYATVNGEKLSVSFIDFVPLGGGRYALQSENERGIAEFAGDELTAFEYVSYADSADPESVSIYPDGAGADAAWLMGGSNPAQHITLTQDSLHIQTPATEDEFFSTPERDIIIPR